MTSNMFIRFAALAMVAMGVVDGQVGGGGFTPYQGEKFMTSAECTSKGAVLLDTCLIQHDEAVSWQAAFDLCASESARLMELPNSTYDADYHALSVFSLSRDVRWMGFVRDSSSSIRNWVHADSKEAVAYTGPIFYPATTGPFPCCGVMTRAATRDTNTWAETSCTSKTMYFCQFLLAEYYDASSTTTTKMTTVTTSTTSTVMPTTSTTASTSVTKPTTTTPPPTSKTTKLTTAHPSTVPVPTTANEGLFPVPASTTSTTAKPSTVTTVTTSTTSTMMPKTSMAPTVTTPAPTFKTSMMTTAVPSTMSTSSSKPTSQPSTKTSTVHDETATSTKTSSQVQTMTSSTILSTEESSSSAMSSSAKSTSTDRLTSSSSGPMTSEMMPDSTSMTSSSSSSTSSATIRSTTSDGQTTTEESSSTATITKVKASTADQTEQTSSIKETEASTAAPSTSTIDSQTETIDMTEFSTYSMAEELTSSMTQKSTISINTKPSSTIASSSSSSKTSSSTLMPPPSKRTTTPIDASSPQPTLTTDDQTDDESESTASTPSTPSGSTISSIFCSPEYCLNRGDCTGKRTLRHCACKYGYTGPRCEFEMDTERDYSAFRLARICNYTRFGNSVSVGYYCYILMDAANMDETVQKCWNTYRGQVFQFHDPLALTTLLSVLHRPPDTPIGVGPFNLTIDQRTNLLRLIGSEGQRWLPSGLLGLNESISQRIGEGCVSLTQDPVSHQFKLTGDPTCAPQQYVCRTKTFYPAFLNLNRTAVNCEGEIYCYKETTEECLPNGVCVCKRGWSGRACEAAINYCAHENGQVPPCIYGWCDQTWEGPYCTCTDGATGEHCEHLAHMWRSTRLIILNGSKHFGSSLVTVLIVVVILLSVVTFDGTPEGTMKRQALMALALTHISIQLFSVPAVMSLNPSQCRYTGLIILYFQLVNMTFTWFQALYIKFIRTGVTYGLWGWRWAKSLALICGWFGPLVYCIIIHSDDFDHFAPHWACMLDFHAGIHSRFLLIMVPLVGFAYTAMEEATKEGHLQEPVTGAIVDELQLRVAQVDSAPISWLIVAQPFTYFCIAQSVYGGNAAWYTCAFVFNCITAFMIGMFYVLCSPVYWTWIERKWRATFGRGGHGGDDGGDDDDQPGPSGGGGGGKKPQQPPKDEESSQDSSSSSEEDDDPDQPSTSTGQRQGQQPQPRHRHTQKQRQEQQRHREH